MSLHYNGANSYLFVNSTGIIKLKAKDYEIVATPLCLGNIWKDLSVDNMKNTGSNGCVYDFSVDYDTIAVHAILDIHKYLMKKNNIISNVCVYWQMFFYSNDVFWLQLIKCKSIKMCFNE